MVMMIIALSVVLSLPNEAAAPIAAKGCITPLKTYPHLETSFTQGLVWFDGALVESTGHYGRSQLLRLELQNASPTQSHPLQPTYFGEGLAWVENHPTQGRDVLIQLTWKQNTAFVYDAHSFALLKSYTYGGEGWGLCFNGQHYVMSDGTDTLQKRSLEDFSLLGTVKVRLDGKAQPMLNELECVGDDIYANVWQSHHIVKIDAHSGHVKAQYDGRDLLSPQEHLHADWFNGIAHDPHSQRWFVTGKYWPKLFEVEFRDICPQATIAPASTQKLSCSLLPNQEINTSLNGLWLGAFFFFFLHVQRRRR
jgi:glutaminyl-peptide cyclotransferase